MLVIVLGAALGLDKAESKTFPPSEENGGRVSLSCHRCCQSKHRTSR